MMNKESTDTKKSISAKQKEELEKHPWLLGMLGSDVMLFLFFITLFKARKLVPKNDYQEMQNLWFGVTVPTVLLIIIVSIFGASLTAKWASNVVSIFASCWLVLVVFRLRNDGYLRQKLLSGTARSCLSAATGGLIFFACGIYLLMSKDFNHGYELVTITLGSIFSFFIAGHLFKLAYIAKH